MKENSKIRNAARASGVAQWEIAKLLGISEATLTRWLRVPLSPDRETRIMDAIVTCSQEKQEAV